MLRCGLCGQRFSSNDILRDHIKRHALQLFDSYLDSDEEFAEKGIKGEQDFEPDLDEGCLVLEFVKEEEDEQLQIQQEEFQVEKGSEEYSLATENFRCSKCSYETINRYAFKVHMNVMHLNKIKCDHCPKRFSTEGKLAGHVRKEHKEDDTKKLPEDDFFRAIMMKKQDKHMRTMYKCLKCKLVTRVRAVIYQHVRGVHRILLERHYKSKGMVLDDAKYHKCTKCFFKTLHIGSLKRHIKVSHQKRRDYICDLCKKAFSDKGNLAQHMRNVHIAHEPSKLHRCSICTYKSMYNRSLKTHMKLVHLKVKEFTCELCQNQFSSKHSIQMHIERNHMEKILRCYLGSKCTFKTTDKRDLMRHIKQFHQKIIGFSCKICGKWYSSPTGFSQHKKQHMKEVYP